MVLAWLLVLLLDLEDFVSLGFGKNNRLLTVEVPSL